MLNFLNYVCHWLSDPLRLIVLEIWSRTDLTLLFFCAVCFSTLNCVVRHHINASPHPSCWSQDVSYNSYSLWLSWCTGVFMCTESGRRISYLFSPWDWYGYWFVLPGSGLVQQCGSYFVNYVALILALAVGQRTYLLTWSCPGNSLYLSWNWFRNPLM